MPDAHDPKRSRPLLLLLGLAALLAVALLAWLAGPAREPVSAPVPDAGGGAATGAAALGDPQGARSVAQQPADRAVTHGAPAWRVSGSVHSRAGALAGARIAAVLETPAGERALPGALSAADGGFAFDLPEAAALAHHERLGATLRLTAWHAGHQPRTQRQELEPRAASRSLEARFLLETGRRLAGRAVDERGAPVAGAELTLEVATQRAGAGGWSDVGTARSDARGRFELGWASPAAYRLRARAAGVGTALLADLALSADEERELGDVTLQGGGPIAGRLIDLSGAGVPDLELWAVDSDLVRTEASLGQALKKAPEVEGPDGLYYARGYTGADGRFEFAGLRPGRYSLRAGDAATVIEPRQGSWEPGFTSVLLEMHTPRLVLHVEDGAGRPLPGARVRLTGLSLAADGSFQGTDVRHELARGARASASFAIEPGQTYTARASGSGALGPEELISMPEEAQQLEHLLLLPAATDRARLQVRLLGPRGEPLAPLRVELLSPLSQLRDEECGTLEPGPDGWLEGLPPGPWLVRAAPRDELAGYCFPAVLPGTVELQPGGASQVTLNAHEGGRVEVELRLVGRPPAGFEQTGPNPDRRRFQVAVLAHRPGEPRGRVLNFALDEGSSSALLPPKRALAHELLEPGDWELVIEHLIWRPVRQHVVIEPGRTLQIALPLSDR